MPRSKVTVALRDPRQALPRALLTAALLLGLLPTSALAASPHALDRLTQAQPDGPPGYTETYAYNAIGNLTSMERTNQWYSDTAHVHAVTHLAGTQAMWYDANGNAITRTVGGVAQRLAWDAENRQASVTQGGVTTAFTYDGDGNRVKINANGVVTAFVGNSYEVNPGTGVTATYYYAGSQRVALTTAQGGATPPPPISPSRPGKGPGVRSGALRVLGELGLSKAARPKALKCPLRTVLTPNPPL